MSLTHTKVPLGQSRPTELWTTLSMLCHQPAGFSGGRRVICALRNVFPGRGCSGRGTLFIFKGNEIWIWLKDGIWSVLALFPVSSCFNGISRSNTQQCFTGFRREEPQYCLMIIGQFSNPGTTTASHNCRLACQLVAMGPEP